MKYCCICSRRNSTLIFSFDLTAGLEVRSDTRRESAAQVPGGAGPGREEETRRAGAGTAAPGSQESVQERGPRTSQAQGQSQRGKSH